jgi:hypothetical protein
LTYKLLDGIKLVSPDKKKAQQVTFVFPNVGLDIGTISRGNSAVLWFGA